MKLIARGVPKPLVRILVFWYANQTFHVKWDNVVSAPFHVGNGVRQGGIWFPFLFNMDMDDLSSQLNKTNTGCLVGESIVNHLMYADYLVPLSLLQQMLWVCSQYGLDHDIKYNAKKSHIMIVRSNQDRKLTFPTFYLSGSPLGVCEEIKYLPCHFWWLDRWQRYVSTALSNIFSGQYVIKDVFYVLRFS